MKNNKGIISIYVLLVMTIILTSALYIVYKYTLEYEIVSLSQKSIQSIYSADSKINLALHKDEYYNNQFLPRVKRYIQYGWFTGNLKNQWIRLDKKDLAEGDTYDKVYTHFYVDDLNGRFMLELKTSALNQQVKKDITATYTLINDFYEMGIPVVSSSTLDESKIEEFNLYLDYIQAEIITPPEESYGVEAIDYEEVYIIKDMDGKINIGFYRNNTENPVKSVKLIDDKIFYICKSNNTNSITYILSNNHLDELSEDNLDEVKLSGVLFIDGDLNICTDLDFSGILIIKGEMIIQADVKVNINGIILSENSLDEFIQNEQLNVNYNFEKFRKYGVYTPKFIEIKEQVIKNN